MALQSDQEFAPTEIARAAFPTAFRGYDQDAVRRYLSRLAAALEHQQTFEGMGNIELRGPADDRVEELEAEIVALQDEVRELETELVQRSVDEADQDTRRSRSAEAQEFDEHRAIELLGQETARVLESARSAAADILKRAENQASSLKVEAKKELVDARRQAKQLVADRRAEAEEAIDQRTAEAEQAARDITEEAEQHRATVVEESSRILADAETEAGATEAEAQHRARQIMADAEALRQQVIAELVADRRAAQTDLDRLSEARDRLALSLAVARSELDELADTLTDVGGAPSPRPDGSSVEVDGDEVARLIDHLDAGRAAVDDSDPHGAGERRSSTVDEPTVEIAVVTGDGPSDRGRGDDVDHDPVADTDEEDPDEGSVGVFGREPGGPPWADHPDVEGDDLEPADEAEAEADDRDADDDREPDVIDLRDDDLRDDDLRDEEVSDDFLNQGGAGSLVEGFNTIVLGDDASAGGMGSRASRDGRSARGRVMGAPEVVPAGTLVADDDDPALVITTVAGRVGPNALSRTQGDLDSDEPLSRRLPALFKARDVAITRSGANLRRQLRRALNDDQSDVLDRLRSGRGKIKVAELMDQGEQVDHFLIPLRRGLSDIARAGARAGGADDVAEVSLGNLVEQLAFHMVDRVRTPTEAAIEEAEHADRERILEPVRTLYRDFRNAGLPDLIDDALHEAFAIGLYDSVEEGMAVRWEIDPRTDPDPVCDVNRDREELFKGEPFPSGHVRPLAVPGCRCLVAPVP